MDKRKLFWLITFVAFVVYYILFGGVSVEGHTSPPLFFLLLDVFASAFLVLILATVMALLVALVPRKAKRYWVRFFDSLPVAHLLVLALLFTMHWLAGDGGPVRP